MSMKNLRKIVGLHSVVFNSIHSQKTGQIDRKEKYQVNCMCIATDLLDGIKHPIVTSLF